MKGSTSKLTCEMNCLNRPDRQALMIDHLAINLANIGTRLGAATILALAWEDSPAIDVQKILAGLSCIWQFIYVVDCRYVHCYP